mmetsp:Transcript_31329/g.92146  ORF Transcript_31329/g.92146 Transcript_31329/m.92146 type:complete len:299 (+) Transcript_31329:790-1686(+)
MKLITPSHRPLGCHPLGSCPLGSCPLGCRPLAQPHPQSHRPLRRAAPLCAAFLCRRPLCRRPFCGRQLRRRPPRPPPARASAVARFAATSCAAAYHGRQRHPHGCRTLRRRTPTRHRTPAVATRIHRNASPPFPPTPCAIGPMRYRPHGRSAPMGDRSVRPSSHIGRWEPPSGGWASRDDAELREQGLNLLGERPYRLDAHDGVGLGDGLGDGQRILEGELLLDARHLLGHRHFEHSRRHGPGGRRARHGALAAPLGLRLRRRWPLHEGAGGGALEGHELVIEGVQVGLPQRLGLIHR